MANAAAPARAIIASPARSVTAAPVKVAFGALAELAVETVLLLAAELVTRGWPSDASETGAAEEVELADSVLVTRG
jgi:hypothetical protein